MSQNTQKKLSGYMPPRVQTVFNVNTLDANETSFIPAVVGIIGDFTGDRKEQSDYKSRDFINISSSNIGEQMKTLKPTAGVSFTHREKEYQEKLLLDSMHSFNPSEIIKNVTPLNESMKLYDQLNALKIFASNSTQCKTSISQIMKGENPKEISDNDFSSEDDKRQFRQLIEGFKQFISTIKTPNNKKEKSAGAAFNVMDPKKFLSEKTAWISKEISDSLNQILHDSKFQKLESSWMGVKKVLSSLPPGEQIKIILLSATKDEIFEDLDNSSSFDSSHLFKIVYERRFGTVGLLPISYIIFDFPMGRSNRDTILNRKLSEVASASHVVMLISIDSSIFMIDNIDKIQSINLIETLQGPQLKTLRALREDDDARYLAFILPARSLGRGSYGPDSNAVKGFEHFQEIITSKEDCLWVSASYNLGIVLGESFMESGWFSSITGYQNGGLVSNIPNNRFQDMDGNEMYVCPCEVAITDRSEFLLSKEGFNVFCYDASKYAFVMFQGTVFKKPTKYNNDEATANSHLSSRLNNVMNACRMTHMIKDSLRRMIGSNLEIEDIQSALSGQVINHTISGTNITADQKRAHPFQNGEVIVKDSIDNPGHTQATVSVVPHDQPIAIKLVIQISKKILGEE